MSPPRALHALGREGEKALGRRPAPLRIARREKHPDIALRQRTEHRVGQGVQHDVAVGMGDDAPLGRDSHPAEPDVVAVGEGMNVEPRADAHDPVSA